MSYTYDISTSKQDNRSTICLSAAHLLFAIVGLFLSTFLVAHIYTLTTDLYSYIINVALYNLSSFVTMIVAYYLFSFWVDKSNRLWVYRVGIIISTLLVILTVFYGKYLAKIIVLAGFLYGLALSAYYASFNVLKQEMVSRKSMNKFAVVVNVLTKLVNVVCPILLGMLIDVTTYSIVAIVVLIISVIMLVLTFFIKAQRPANSSFNVREYLKKLNENKPLSKKIKRIYLLCFIYSSLSVVSTLISVNIMIHFGSSFGLGSMTSIASLVSVVVIMLSTKFTKYGKRAWLYIVNAIMVVIASIVFAAYSNLITLIIFYMVHAVGEVIVTTHLDIVRNKNLKEAGLYDDIAEHQCIVETMFQISRIIGYGSLVLAALFRNTIILQVLLVVFVVIFASSQIILLKYEKDETNEQIDQK